MPDIPAIIQDYLSDTERLAAIHNAGHFVLCWHYGIHPVGIKREKEPLEDYWGGNWDFGAHIDKALEAFRVCLFGGDAAVSLPINTDHFLLGNNLAAVIGSKEQTDTRAVAQLCQTEEEYQRAFLTAHDILKHYETKLFEVIGLLMHGGTITDEDARHLYAKWGKPAYRPSKRKIAKAIARLRAQQKAEKTLRRSQRNARSPKGGRHGNASEGKKHNPKEQQE